MQSEAAPLVQAEQWDAHTTSEIASTSAVDSVIEGPVIGSTRGRAVFWVSERRVDDLDGSRRAGSAVVGLSCSTGRAERIAGLTDKAIRVVIRSVVAAGCDTGVCALNEIHSGGTGLAGSVVGASAAIAVGVAVYGQKELTEVASRAREILGGVARVETLHGSAVYVVPPGGTGETVPVLGAFAAITAIVAGSTGLGGGVEVLAGRAGLCERRGRNGQGQHHHFNHLLIGSSIKSRN